MGMRDLHEISREDSSPHRNVCFRLAAAGHVTRLPHQWKPFGGKCERLFQKQVPPSPASCALLESWESSQTLRKHAIPEQMHEQPEPRLRREDGRTLPPSWGTRDSNHS